MQAVIVCSSVSISFILVLFYEAKQVLGPYLTSTRPSDTISPSTSMRGGAASPRLTVRLGRGGPVPTLGLAKISLAAKTLGLPIVVYVTPTLP